ncbi:Tfp pilus assembly protein PilF [Pseudoxanthomonas sp. GM95]|uniref:tetratricopeptide repeat protein n=1 Tax=Pseudoxanthomonas sp. GM95 TaxID=1881043 RepID=UPI0008BDE886|nr:tetratricopeptide repeat protein [Pseudoxanthomonas sp. GM95]SEL45748.1 Tfp pilus assembly protein PilF [Pseudoxanthomonas sp. GM95]
MSVLASFLLASALAVAPPPPTLPAPALPPPAQETLLEIPPELRHLLQQRVVRRSQSEPERLQRLVHLMFDSDGLALQYGASDTHSVAESFATRRINCLSFTLMFVALARQVGLTARAQEVGQALAWYEHDGLGYSYGHVNVQVRMDGRVVTVDLDSSVLVDRRGPRTIPDTRLFAHYYNNRATELMAVGDNAQARAYFVQALRVDPKLVDAWNNLGLLEAREGALNAAAADYTQALMLDPQYASAMSNAFNLYRRMGDDARASQMLVRLQQVRVRDPFHQYTLGMEAERNGDYASAIRDYNSAIGLYPDAHQFHFALARVAFLSGNSALADRELRLARSLGPPGDQQRYQAKLESLQRLRQANRQ